jgi:hypothetical protein
MDILIKFQLLQKIIKENFLLPVVKVKTKSFAQLLYGIHKAGKFRK